MWLLAQFAGQRFDGTPREVRYNPALNPRAKEEEALLAALPVLVQANMKFEASALDISGYREPWKQPSPEFGILPPLTQFRRAVEIACPGVLRWSWNSMRRRRDHRDEFFEIALKLEKYLEVLNGFDDSSRLGLLSLTPEEDKRFDIIYDELLPGDVLYYYSLVSLELRRREQHL